MKVNKRRAESLIVLTFIISSIIVTPILISLDSSTIYNLNLEKNQKEIEKDEEEDSFIPLSSNNPPNANHFKYYKVITIDSDKVEGAGDHTNFPLLLSIIDSDLHDYSQSDGDDIAFSNGPSWLDHEIEQFDSTYSSKDAKLVAWIEIPFLSTSVDTIIYMYYGNSTMNFRQNPSGVWDSDYAAVYHLNENPTGTVYDSTNNNNDGTTYGSMTSEDLIDGQIGKAFDLDGSNDYIRVADASSLDITSNITMQAWLNVNSQGWDVIFSKGYYSAAYSYYLDLNRYVYYYLNGAGGQRDTGDLVSLNTYASVVVTWDEVNAKVFIDGSLVDSIPLSGTIVTNSDPLWIGCMEASDHFRGILDEVRVSSNIRSEGWISTEYNNQYDPMSFYSISGRFELNPPNPEDFNYYKVITIDSNKVDGTGSHTNFPLLVSILDSDLHDDVQSDGDDIAFYNGTTWLDHEIEIFDQNYNPTQAQLIAWVRIPSLSASTDTSIFMYYGNSSMETRQNPSGVWNKNYVSVWHLHEDPTGVIFDSTSNNYDGPSTGSMTISDQVDGKIDGSLDFDGIDDHINIGKIDSNAWTAITLEAWIKMDNTGDDRIVAKEENTGGGNYIWILGKSGNNLKCRITTDGIGGDFTGFESSGGLTVGNWHYVAMTWDSTSEIFIGYIDGVSVANFQRDGTTILDSTVDVTLGDLASGVRQFDGIISETRISTKAWSNDWINTTYNNQNNPDSFYSIGAEQYVYITLKVNALDLDGNSVPNINISMYQNVNYIMSEITNINGSALFLDVVKGLYNFTATLTSDFGNFVENVNFTSEAILVDLSNNLINLTCNIGSNFFMLFDIDGEPVESGYILVSNTTDLIRNCSIDENGKARFWWINATPYEYNYTVKYQNLNYNPSEITLARGNLTNINAPNDPIVINVNLTTVNFTIFGQGSVVPGANLILKRSDNQKSIVNLITDDNGKATLRWLNSSEFLLGSIVNYSLQISFFGFPLFFNITIGGDSNYDKYNFTVIARDAYQFNVDINPTQYQTELISLNPTDNINLKWGTELKIRVLFNVSDAGGKTLLLGPTDADSMSYDIFDGDKHVKSGILTKEGGITGRYQCSIDTSQLESDKGYKIEVSAIKSGFTQPLALDIILFLLINHMELNQSQNDDTPMSVFWLEIANMSINPYGQNSEMMVLEDDIYIGENNKIQVSIPHLYNYWNLTSIEFDIYNVQHGKSELNIQINITDPFNNIHSWDSNNKSNYYYHSPDATNGTWIDLTIVPTNDFSISNNIYDFIIEGTFVDTVQLVTEATFTRNKINVEYFESNITDSIIISSDGNGWAIKNMTFELINCKNSTGDLINPANYIDNMTTNEGHVITNIYNAGIGYGKIFINDTIIYPLNNQYIFFIGNNSAIIFDVIIKVEYIQEFYKNQYLEIISFSNTVENFASGLLQINPDDMSWNDQGTTLFITDLKDSGFNDVYPSEVAMNITIDGNTYHFQDGAVKGQGFIILQNAPKDMLLMGLIQANDIITFNISFKSSYLRNVFYEITGTITCLIKEAPNIPISVSYNEKFRYYETSIDTSSLQSFDYTVKFICTKAHYDVGIKELDLNVLERLTLINGAPGFYQQFSSIYVSQIQNYNFFYIDSAKGTRIIDLDTQEYIWEYYGMGTTILSSGQGNLITTSDDEYLLDFNTETHAVGRYSLVITLDKDNYMTKIAILSLTIMQREIDYDLGDVFEKKQVNVVKGKTITLEIELTDPVDDSPIRGAKVILEIDDDEFEFEEVEDGIYELEFKTDEYEAFFNSITLTGTIKISKANYTTEDVDITIVIEIEEIEVIPEVLGIPIFYLLLLITAIGTVVGSLGIYKYIQIAKIPKFVKKARAMKKAIKAGNNITESLLTTSKEESILKQFENEWEEVGISLEEVLRIKPKKDEVMSNVEGGAK